MRGCQAGGPQSDTERPEGWPQHCSGVPDAAGCTGVLLERRCERRCERRWWIDVKAVKAA